jgi:hypothetical protein
LAKPLTPRDRERLEKLLAKFRRATQELQDALGNVRMDDFIDLVAPGRKG